MAIVKRRRSAPLDRDLTDALAVSAREWRAPTVDMARVNAEMGALWAALGQRAEGTGQPVQDPTAPVAGRDDGHESRRGVHTAQLMTRSSTVNVVAVARSPREAERLERAIVGLPDFQPARVILLILNESQPEGDDAFTIRASILEQPAAKHRSTIRFEMITVEVNPSMAEDFASVASPLLVSELADYLWWPGDGIVPSSIFRNLAEIMDDVIVDTASLSRMRESLPAIRALTTSRSRCPRVSDFVWQRLTIWRQLVAQFFDSPTTRHALNTITDVDIVYAPANERGTSGFSAALLVAGWLVGSLGWVPTGPIERTRTGYRLPLSTQPDDRSVVNAVIRLRPHYDSNFADGLGAITLRTGGPHSGTFSVARTSASDLTTSSNSRDLPHVSRVVLAPIPSDAELLGVALDEGGWDKVYELALDLASRWAAPDRGTT
ncbi:MAG: glucose-6-phosphate dehydrogenase assembly protein OpcA [Chloroflexota bacterium]|nr:glucose-6-phosphate dehydrogenase assembly protein OpcA [Chloroflexota bacterium]